MRMKRRRLIALFMAVLMIVSMLPMTAFAEGSEQPTETTANVVAKIGDIEYETLAKAVEAATEGQTVTLLKDCSEAINMTLTASITIDGGEKTMSGGMKLDGNGSNDLTVQNFKFETNGLDAYNFKKVTVGGKDENVGNTFTNITGKNRLGVADAILVLNANMAVVDGNTIDGADEVGIDIANIADSVEVKGNSVKNTSHNSLQIVAFDGTSKPEANVSGNTFENWGCSDKNNEGKKAGRAFRGQLEKLDFNSNKMINNAAPEEFVKLTDGGDNPHIDVSANYWNGGDPSGNIGEFQTAYYIGIGEDKNSELKNYYSDAEMETLVTISAEEEGIKTAEEFATALAEGGEIKLADDISYTTSNYGQKAEAILVSKDTTIDLNGFTLDITTTSSAGRYSIYVDTDATLTIKDSSPENKGVMNVKSEYASKAAYIFYVYGTLDIQGGTINQEASYSSSYGIDVMSSGTFKMSGGKLPKGTKMKSGGYTLYANSGTKIITGGVIEEYYAGSTVSGWEISGGVFETQPTYEMMKPGYITYKITDEGATKGWYGVKEGTYVGLVGTTVYTDMASFANAIGGNKITVDGNKLTLTGDVNLGSASANKVTFLSNITLDLAGHSITGAVAGSSAYMFYVNQKEATVTIMDSVGGGKVENSTSSYCKTVMVNKGTLVVDSAKIVGKTTGTNVTTVITNGSTSSSDPKVVLKNGAVISVENGNTAKSSSTGIINYGSCEIDDSTVDVISGSGATAISPCSSSVLKIGKNSTGKSTIKATGTGKNTSQAISLYGISNSSSGAFGEVYISNADVILTTDKGESTNAQTCYAVRFASASNGTYEIGDNVSISVSGTCGTDNTVYGLYAYAGKITGSNVSIDVEGDNANARYGIYRNQAADFTIDPGTNVSITVNGNKKETGTNYLVDAFSTGKVLIHGGTYNIYGTDASNGMLVSGGTFNFDPSAYCDLGYLAQENTPSEGLWTVVEDTTIRVKNVTQDKTYSKISQAVEEAISGDELQLLENISSSAELTLSDINFDLNGYDINLNKLNTMGNVTITDKQAKSYDNAGKLTAAIEVGAGKTTITKCNHALTTSNTNLRPLTVGGTEENQAQLAINGVKGEYKLTGSATYYTIYVKDYSNVTIDNVEGFETNLTQENNASGQIHYMIYCNGNSPVIINDGTFSATCKNGNSVYLFYNKTNALVKGGKFNLSGKADYVKIANNTSSTIEIQGGYYAPKVTDGDYIDQNTFFGNATALAESEYSAKTLTSDDPLYAEGYRYTVAEIAVAEIDGKTYPSLTKAIDAAQDTDTVKLLEDVTLNEYTLSKNVNFDGNGHSVKLTGNKPLMLAAGVALPECFDVSDSIAYIERKSGEKIFYKYWISYATPNYGLMDDYDDTTDKQIVLTKDMTVGSGLSVYKTCTIDLNGFTIKGEECQYEAFNIGASSYGSVVCTIKDSSEAKTGKITGSNNDYYTVCMDTDGDTLILESGTIENTSEMGAGICVMDGYGAAENMTVTINGGKVKTNGGFAIVDNGQYSRNVNININGGEVSSNGGVTIYHPASGTITLNGGTISGATGIYIRSGSLIVPKESTVKVRATGTKGTHNPEYSGGAEMTGDAIVICESAYPGGKVSADIAGGAFYSKNAFAVASYATTGQTAIKGFLKGGIYGADSAAIDISNRNLIATGYKDIPNPDTATKEDHPWMIGVPPVAPTVDEEAREESATQADVPGTGESGLPEKVVDEVIDEISKNTSVSGDEATNIQTEAVESKIKEEVEKTSGVKLVDSTSQLKITVKSVATKTTETQISAISAQTVTTTKAKYDVKPYVTIETTDEEGQKTTETRVITNAELAAAEVSIAFRLAVPESMKSASVVVKHYPNDTGEGNPDWSKAYPVKGTGNNRYVELEASAFSVYEIEDLLVQDKVAVNENTGVAYDTLEVAIEAATDGQTVTLLKECAENIVETISASITINGNGNKLTGGMKLDGNGSNDLTVQNFKLETKGLDISNFDGVTVKDNEFKNITGSNRYGFEDAMLVQESKDVTISGNTIDGADEVGINARDISGELTITNNTVKNTAHNSVQIVKGNKATMPTSATVTGNTFENWGIKPLQGKSVAEGRALRGEVTNLTFTGNVMKAKDGGAPEQYVKLTSTAVTTEIDASQNYWDGYDPNGKIGTSNKDVYIGVSSDFLTEISSYYKDAAKENLLEYVAQNVQTKKVYTVLETALSEAEEQATSAENARTIILLKDLTDAKKVTYVEVAPNVTLDLNGYNLEAKTVVAFGLVKNNTSTGKLIVAEDHFAYFGGKEVEASTENVMPVWDTTGGTEGYVFYSVTSIGKEWQYGIGDTEHNPKYRFQPHGNEISKVLADNSGVKVYVEFNYTKTTTDEHGTEQSHDYHLIVEFGRTFITQFLLNPENTIMYVSLLGTENVSSISARAILKAENCNFSIVSDRISTPASN